MRGVYIERAKLSWVGRGEEYVGIVQIHIILNSFNFRKLTNQLITYAKKMRHFGPNNASFFN